jgi:hypothetical protein
VSGVRKTMKCERGTMNCRKALSVVRTPDTGLTDFRLDTAHRT